MNVWIVSCVEGSCLLASAGVTHRAVDSTGQGPVEEGDLLWGQNSCSLGVRCVSVLEAGSRVKPGTFTLGSPLFIQEPRARLRSMSHPIPHVSAPYPHPLLEVMTPGDCTSLSGRCRGYGKCAEA